MGEGRPNIKNWCVKRNVDNKFTSSAFREYIAVTGSAAENIEIRASLEGERSGGESARLFMQKRCRNCAVREKGAMLAKSGPRNKAEESYKGKARS